MHTYVRDLRTVGRAHLELVGGKGASLGELSRVDGIRVPDGFCVTTDAFRHVISQVPSIDHQLERLSRLDPDDREAIGAVSAEIRGTIAAIAMPADLREAIVRSLDRLGNEVASAVRSSATAEDLPTASFAGQQDTYLNVFGATTIMQHIIRCWASLFTDRAVTYRMQTGLDHRKVYMAVIVQRMVVPQVAGILFTADPVTGNRKVASIEASFDLGEALVSGMVNADVYKVRDGEVVDRSVGDKQLAIHASPAGGTRQQAVAPERRGQPALTDAQVLRLAELGRRIEAHFGRPQDIEWCLADDAFLFVQSRPITTIFPAPVVDDGQNHVYISVGHQQMMTDAMRPLGLSVWQHTTPRPMHAAGGRLFVDVTREIASPASRERFLELVGRSDPLIRDALLTVIDRGDFIPSLPDAEPAGPAPSGDVSAPLEPDPAIVDDLIASSEASIANLERVIRGTSGLELIDIILADFEELRRVLFDPRSHQVIMAGMEATWWLNQHLQEWLGETNAADTLTQSVPNNVTSEMGLALLDVADAIRPYPEVVAYLERVEDDGFLDELPELPGGQEARDAIRGWLDRYGMRCVGEIDITTPRWCERPAMLLPILLGNIRNFEEGAGRRRFEQGRLEAQRKEQELLERLRTLPDGERKADETRRMIARLRTFVGYREYPKYGMISRYFVYKQALLGEAGRLVRAGVLSEPEDMYYLTLEELRDVVRTQQVDDARIRRRREDFRSYQALTPPRVLTSDGEAITGSYRRQDVPAGALVGLAVSAGVVEGRARVLLDVHEADLQPGDILVTAYTDPSWTPLFVSVAGVVTEVGGMTTHGAVIAREYGLPAVVGVEQATRRIQDGQRIRVHGSDGYVEILP